MTSSPYKAKLEAEEKEKNEKNKPKKRLFETLEKKRPAKKGKRQEGKKIKPEKLRESSSDEEQDACIFCNELYLHSKAKEGWIQCSQCHGWAHEACTNVEEEDDTFICDFCA